MAFDRPELSQLVDRAAASMAAATGASAAFVRRRLLNVLAVVHSGATHGLYGYLAWLADQPFPDTADLEYLRRWATILRISEIEAGHAAAVVRMTGTTGTSIPAGTRVSKADGLTLLVDADAELVDGAADVAVVAELPGAASSVYPGETVRLVSPIAGVASVATVLAEGLVSGADAETPESLRERVLARFRQPPHGGAAADYIEWARQIPGVTRVWVRPRWLSDGYVGVLFVRDGDPDSIIPSEAEVAAMQAHLEEVRPVTAHPWAMAPTPIAVDITLSVTPNTPTVRSAVERSLAELFAHQAEPGGVMRLTHLHQVVSDTPGEVDHDIAVPADDVTVMQHEIPVLGEITWA